MARVYAASKCFARPVGFQTAPLPGCDTHGLTAASPPGVASFADNCVSRSICLIGIVASCAEHAKAPIATARHNIVPFTAFMIPSSRLAFAPGGFID
jgi:hypothetical protein